MKILTLASKSPARAALLKGAGLTFETAAPGVDEEAMKAGMLTDGAGPREIADALAEMKAMKVSRRLEGLVIGADTTLDLDGTLVDKAPDLAAARARLISLRGRSHVLHSAVVVAEGGQPIWREVKSARLHVRNFSDAFLDRYMTEAGEGALLHSVGCYHLEGLGVQLFEKIDGDYFTILGLPMLGLLDLLRRHGVVEI